MTRDAATAELPAQAVAVRPKPRRMMTPSEARPTV
jgi:hypothetical protein